MKATAAALALAIAAGPSPAQEDFLSAEAFRARVEGRAVRTDVEGGATFGVEVFEPGNRVLWHGADGSCLSGHWRARGTLICYRYTGEAGESCLRYRAAPGGRLTGYQWDPSGEATGFLGLVLTLTPSDRPLPTDCRTPPVS